MPASGFYFDRWEGFEQVEEKEEVDLILTQDLILTAIFLPLPKLSDEVLVFNIKKIDPKIKTSPIIIIMLRIEDVVILIFLIIFFAFSFAFFFSFLKFSF